MTELSYLEVVEQRGRAVVANGVIQSDQVDALRRQRHLGGRGVRVYVTGVERGTFSRLVRLLPDTLRRVLVDVIDLPRVPNLAAAVLDEIANRRITTHWAALDPGRRQLSELDAIAAGNTSRLVESWVRSLQATGLLVEVEAGREAIEHLIDDLRVDEPPAQPALPGDTPAAAAKRAELLQQGWPDSVTVGRWLGSAADSNPSQYATRLRSQGKLLGVRVPGTRAYHHPLCQFGQDHTLLPVMTELLALLPPGNGSGWSQAFWLYAPHPLLDGALPADLLATEPERVLEAAREQFEEDADARG